MNGDHYYYYYYHYCYRALQSHPDIGSEFPKTLWEVEETVKVLVFLSKSMQWYIPIHSFIFAFIHWFNKYLRLYYISGTRPDKKLQKWTLLVLQGSAVR